jgi:hypothetical protein
MAKRGTRTGWQLDAEHDAAMAAARRGRPDTAGMALRVLGAILLCPVAWASAVALVIVAWVVTMGIAN